MNITYDVNICDLIIAITSVIVVFFGIRSLNNWKTEDKRDKISEARVEYIKTLGLLQEYLYLGKKDVIQALDSSLSSLLILYEPWFTDSIKKSLSELSKKVRAVYPYRTLADLRNEIHPKVSMDEKDEIVKFAVGIKTALENLI